MVGVEGVTAIVTSAVAGIVRVVFPETVPEVAVIVVCPGATAVTVPFDATVATEVVDEAQVTVDVRSPVVPSE
jgi:hypothetical protein